MLSTTCILDQCHPLCLNPFPRVISELKAKTFFRAAQQWDVARLYGFFAMSMLPVVARIIF